MLSFLPEVLGPMLKGGRFAPVEKGCSPARVYRIAGAEVAADCFLKIDIPRPRGLDREAAACFWLRGRFPAPEVLFLGEFEGNVFLLTTAVPGTDACSGENSLHPGLTARLLARTMDELHRLNCAGCPLDNRPDDLLKNARIQLRPPQSGGDASPADLLARLEASPPPCDPVFCHGDFCLPNILYEGGALTGVIDLGDAGAGDRHLDLSLCCWSLRYNFGDEKYVDEFLDEYGRDRVDPRALRWYADLNDLYL